jgi:uroporphyrinogen-III decarboxylase
LIATLKGEPVDRPAVNFYEIGGFAVDPDDPDPFNVYNSPSWKPLLKLAEEETDIVRIVDSARPWEAGRSVFFKVEKSYQGGSFFTRTIAEISNRTLTSLTRRDPQLNTIWTLEHLLKDAEDLKVFLGLPDKALALEPNLEALENAERAIGDKGLVMVDTADPICLAAQLFSMEDYTVIAFTERKLFHALLERLAPGLYDLTGRIAREFPGHLWRIYGPEYATEPYLPPALFEEYVVRYTEPMVRLIHKGGGFVRLHCHGRVRSALPFIHRMGVDAIDPIEPPPQGDVELRDVREKYGRSFILFGNIEVSDIEQLEPEIFEKVAAKVLRDGTSGRGRGFILMPTSAPYGREITPKTMANYETMVRLAVNFSG